MKKILLRMSMLRFGLAMFLCFSLSFCGGDSKKEAPPTCEITGQNYNAGTSRCECSGNQFLNSARDACVRSCGAGEIKPDNKDTCELEMTCSDGQILNPLTNECISSNCAANEVIDTTLSSPECILTTACRSDADKFVNVAGNACITQSACTAVARQVATGGDCQVCANDKVRSATLDECLDSCPQGYVQTTNSDTCEMATVCGEGQTLNRQNNTCIADNDSDNDGVPNGSDNCQNTINTNQANTDNDAMGDACDTDDDNDGVDDVNDACPTASLNPASGNATDPTADPDMDGCKNSEDTDDDNDDVPDTGDVFPNDACASVDTDGDDAPDSVLMSCSTTLMVDAFPNDACASVDTDEDDAPDSVLMSCSTTLMVDAFPNDACASVDTDEDGMPNTLVDSCSTTLTEDTDDDNDGVADGSDTCPIASLNPASGNANDPTADPDMDGCKNSEDDDDDNDGVEDVDDACPMASLNPASGNASAPTADPDNDGCKNSEDVDNDNDGLIEIATASELNNMRHNLAGTTYDDEIEDITPGDTGSKAGGPASATDYCASATGGVYLCGYELVADIDLSGADQNSGTAGNFDPIGNLSSGHFTAYLEGNGYTINNLNIDITGVPAGDNDANDAAFIASCRGVLSNLVLADAVIHGRRRVAVLCARMNGGAVRNVQITGSSTVQSSNSSSFDSLVGGLVGQMLESNSISNSAATVNVSVSSPMGSSFDISIVGGLVGSILLENLGQNVSISNSYATGDVFAHSRHLDIRSGGLIGSQNSRFGGANINISNCYATGSVSVNTTNHSANSYSGGLMGLVNNSVSISNSYATGDISNDSNQPSSTLDSGGLVGSMFAGSISNSYATGDVFVYFMNTGSFGGLLGQNFGSISNSYYNSEAMQVENDMPRLPSALKGVGSETTDPAGVSSQTLSQIQLLPATDSDNDSSTPQLKWDDTNHWAQVGTAGKFPLLRYGDNPHTGVNECESLPGFGNTDTDKVRCGDLLPLQELYRASGNLTFSNTTIGIPTSSAPEFFYSVDSATVTVTYNLATGVTLTASGVEQEDGTATTNVSWSQGTNAGTISDIEENDTFWLALTFQQGSVTHKVRWKFERPTEETEATLPGPDGTDDLPPIML